MNWPDINLDMNIFDWFKPLDKAIDVVDKLVLDKDAANELKGELSKADKELRAMAEHTYRAELDTKTVPWVDALHKMGRQILSLINILVVATVLLYMVHKGQDLDLETFLAVTSIGGPAAIYNYAKGKGKQ